MTSTKRPKWVRYKDYSGLKLVGTNKVPIPDDDLHMGRAYWLTSQLEAPYYGTVQNYDGTGMSGGPMHNIAVYPRNMKQGSLFPLLRRLEIGEASSHLLNLWDALKEAGWYVARDGKLRDYQNGKQITGRAIRNEFSPTDGRVPTQGKKRQQAEKWVTLFHELFSDPATFYSQVDFAVDYLIKGRQADELAAYGERTVLEDLRVTAQGLGKSVQRISPEQDLAMCVYHAYSVNAPSPAVRALRKTLRVHPGGVKDKEFARRLIWNLGKTKYGRWSDLKRGYNRYDATRKHALRSGLWEESLFYRDAIMPKDLPGRP